MFTVNVTKTTKFKKIENSDGKVEVRLQYIYYI